MHRMKGQDGINLEKYFSGNNFPKFFFKFLKKRMIQLLTKIFFSFKHKALYKYCILSLFNYQHSLQTRKEMLTPNVMLYSNTLYFTI